MASQSIYRQAREIIRQWDDLHLMTDEQQHSLASNFSLLLRPPERRRWWQRFYLIERR